MQYQDCSLKTYHGCMDEIFKWPQPHLETTKLHFFTLDSPKHPKTYFNNENQDTKNHAFEEELVCLLVNES